MTKNEKRNLLRLGLLTAVTAVFFVKSLTIGDAVSPGIWGLLLGMSLRLMLGSLASDYGDYRGRKTVERLTPKTQEKKEALRGIHIHPSVSRGELIQTARDLYDGYKESGNALDSDLQRSAFYWADLITEATIEDEDYTTLRAAIINSIEARP